MPIQSFRSVNRRDRPGFRDGWQRHHLIPLELLSDARTREIFASIERFRFSLGDFRTNGVLLPATADQARDSGLPLHGGPHPRYNRAVRRAVVEIGRDARHPLARLARMRLLQAQLRSALMTSGPSPRTLDAIDVSADTPAHRALDAEVHALLDGLAPPA